MEIIVGAVVSLLVQAIKKYVGTSEYWTLGAVLVISLAAAAVYTALVSAGLWESFVQIVIVAGAFYAYIISRFKNA